MTDNEALTQIFEAIAEQAKAIRDVKIQAESLKQMMFEHRPQFVPAFAEQVKKVTASSGVRQLDSFIAALQELVRELRNG